MYICIYISLNTSILHSYGYVCMILYVCVQICIICTRVFKHYIELVPRMRHLSLLLRPWVGATTGAARQGSGWLVVRQ